MGHNAVCFIFYLIVITTTIRADEITTQFLGTTTPPSDRATSTTTGTTTSDLASTSSYSESSDAVYSPISENSVRQVIINTTSLRSACHLRPVEPKIYDKILDLVALKAKLIEYHIRIVNYTQDPLDTNITWSYEPKTWSRIRSQHGQTLLSLAFNYGVLSLMTLSFGVEKLDVDLEDIPYGCMGTLSEGEKVDILLDLLLRDLRPDHGYLKGDEGVCHQIIQNNTGVAKFTDMCCKQEEDSGLITCTTDIMNIWLYILDLMIRTIKVSLILFGPLLAPGYLYSNSLDSHKYLVKLKEPLYKKIFVSDDGATENIKASRTLDLRLGPKFKKCMKILAEVPKGEVLNAKVTEFRISVNYHKLLTENKVPVGMIRSLSRALCQCKLREVEVCQPCCDASIFGPYRKDKPISWIFLLKLIGTVVLFLSVPIPMYLRALIYDSFEKKEVMERKHVTASLGLREPYEFRLMHYLTPSHPIFVFIYIIYFVTAIMLGCMEIAKSTQGKYKRVIIGSFKDMKSLSWVNAIGLVVSLSLWPFKKFGCLGLLVGLVYWPVAIPLALCAFLFYCLPLIYLTFRMLLHSRKAIRELKVKQRQGGKGPVFHTGLKGKLQNVLKELEIHQLLHNISPRRHKDDDDDDDEQVDDVQSGVHGNELVILHSIASMMCIVTMYAIVIAMAECAGFMVEVMIFTMMGIIVNAGAVLRYVTLVFLIGIYSYDCYNNVNKKYLKLNKAIFKEIKGRIKDLYEVTRLPAHLQENRGFKACEASDQAEFESIDDIHETLPRHLDLNDLILFVDSHDMPRIPMRLFEDVCEIRVAGAPGPVWKSLLEATYSFMIIVTFLFFVFLVVASFGSMYKISSSNQMMATLAGGFFPFLMRNLFKPTTPDVEVSSVSFQSKLDEIIENFHQPWPMQDFHFELYDPDELAAEQEEGEGEKKDEKDSKEKPQPIEKETLPPKLDTNFNESNNSPERDALLPAPSEIDTIAKISEIDTIGKTNSSESIEVDLLIYMPQGSAMSWIGEWSRQNSTDIPDDEETSLAESESIV